MLTFLNMAIPFLDYVQTVHLLVLVFFVIIQTKYLWNLSAAFVTLAVNFKYFKCAFYVFISVCDEVDYS